MAYVQFRFFSDYVEEPNRSRSLTEYFAPVYSTQSMEKLEMDTLRTHHLPLQEPPPTYPSGNRFSL